MSESAKTQRYDAVSSLPPLREIISEHGLNAQKSLGQNFLLDMNITDKIVREAAARDGAAWGDAHAVEIGPGPGGLTRALLKSEVLDVLAVEYDPRAVVALQSLTEAADGDLTLREDDALKVDLTQAMPSPRVIVANLPYNVATPLLVGWLKQIRLDPRNFQSMTLMFQKEVADRICAAPNTKAYGRLAVIAQWLCDVEVIYDLPPSAFTPPPKVMSSVVYFKPKPSLDIAPDFSVLEKVTAAAFNQRRKMVRSSLKAYADAFEPLGIDPQKRAENLSANDYIRIAQFAAENGL